MLKWNSFVEDRDLYFSESIKLVYGTIAGENMYFCVINALGIESRQTQFVFYT